MRSGAKTVSAATSSLRYPVLMFSRGTVSTSRTEDELTTCSKTALSNGFFSGLLLIDSDGLSVKVKSATKSHGVGFLWGYNIFLNQKIKVSLLLEDNAQCIDFGEVKAKVIKAIRTSHAWGGGSDVRDVALALERASNVSDIAIIIFDAYEKPVGVGKNS